MHFGFLLHKLCPKTPKFWCFGAKMGLAHDFKRNDILSCVGTFYGLRTSKQCDLHLQTSFLGAGIRFYWPIAFGPGSGPAHANVCIPTLTSNISCSRIFPTKVMVYRLKEYILENLEKILFHE